MAWKLINMRVEESALAEIDAEAHRLGLTRTAYMVQRSRPSKPTDYPLPDPRPDRPPLGQRSATVVVPARRQRVEVMAEGHEIQIGPVARKPGSMLKVKK